jgi:hypothetical protein
MTKGSTAFIGFTDVSHQITSISILSVIGDPIGVDDVRFGSVSVFLPDTGSTLMLLSGALAGLGVVPRIR